MHAKLARLVFGGTCFVCRGTARGTLCASCDADLPRLVDPSCPRCALASPSGALCGHCLAQPPHYDATIAALAYAFPADALVHALKFRGELALAEYLAGILGRCLADPGVDSVIAVPLSAARLRSRGYNQAVEIARSLFPKKIDLDLCVRGRDTPAQMDLPYEERRRNVRGAFRVRRAATVPTAVALVDDVYTTGATLDACARALRDAGAEVVDGFTLARAVRW